MIKQIDKLLSRRAGNGPAKGLRMVRNERCAGFVSGLYERSVQDFLQATLRAGDVFVDAGANVGFLTMLGARLVGPTGSIHAFEPVPENVSVIRRNLAVNGFRNGAVISKALGATAGTENIWITHHPGGATLASVGEVPRDASEQIEVQRTTLDHWIDTVHLESIRVIKVDVEGAELDVLRGMPRLLARFRPILLVELDATTAEGLQQKEGELVRYCERIGYKTERMPDSYSNRDHHVAHFVATAA